MVMATLAGAVSAFTARAAIGTTDTFIAVFLGFVNIERSKSEDNNKYGDNNDILHL